MDAAQRFAAEHMLDDAAEAAIREAIAAEREACAALCDYRACLQRIRAQAECNNFAAERAIEAEGCAAAIRARGN